MTLFQKISSFCRHAGFLLACLAIFASPACAAANLCIEAQDGKLLYSTPVHEGSQFAIRYIHSVAQSPVTDYFQIKDNSIWLDKTVYHDFGAGLPHSPEPGQHMDSKNGELIISGYDKNLGSFQLRVGRIANHILLIKPDHGQKDQSWQELSIDKLAAPGAAVTFIVRKTK